MSLLTNVLKLWRTGQYLLPADSGFMVKHLFANGEQGAWYDPADLSTLFQDAAGTTPVTAVEQPVGLMLDKTKPIVTNGAERMNVLPSEAADWGGGNNTVVGNKIIPNTTNGYHGPYKNIPSTGLDYIIKVKAKAAGYSKFYISDASHGRVRAAYDLANGTIISAVSNIPHDAAIVHLGDGVYELSVKVNAVTAIALAITPYPDTGATLSAYYASFAGDGVSGVEVYAVDARLVTQADTLPRYQYTPANTWSRFMGSTHATQATSTKRPVYSRRVNLLTNTEDFSNAAWTTGKTVGASVASNTTIAPNGELTADTVTLAAPSDYLYQTVSSFNAVAGSSIILKYCSKVTARLITFGGATPAGTDVHDYIDIGGGWYEHKTTRTFSVSVTGTVQVLPNGSIVGAGSFAIWGASLVLAADAHLPYQRVNTAADYDADPNKFPAYLACDGIDDAMQTGNIDFTGTDKMTVWAGYAKINDGPTSIFLETGSVYTGGGGIGMFTSDSSGNLFGIAHSDITGNKVMHLDSAATEIGLITSRYDLQVGATTSARRNSGAWGFAAASGGGFLGNRPLYIGARAGTSAFFKGRLYSLIVRGAQSSLSQIEATEAYIKQKMRLP